MATFPSIDPTYNSQKRSQPKLRITQFNDGYQNRIKFGQNIDPKVWSLTFNVSESDSDTIEAFLEARADDGASFDWQPPAEPAALKWICLSWTKTIPYVNRATIQTTFQQVFEP